MKIFFLADRRDQSKFDNYEKIIAEFLKNGDTVDRSWIDKSSTEDAQDFEHAYKRNMHSIKEADTIVAEVSELSSGVGFLISTALTQKKPVLALFNEETKSLPSTTLKGSNNKFLIFRDYNIDKLDVLIREFKNKVKNIIDTKFILIIPAEIDRYMEWSSKEKRMHKAQIVREAIEKMIAKDSEYKNYLDNL